ncbi:IclR family transcriptional regulator [Micromonospora sp. DR5-3]|uniref:IclR family transcriptional regulator n=1 Tax=Micromonospora sp. DR5-3 TaxID=2992129 RepID=UPI0022329829|nr:IclR family transcriptional regulator [Micromonospora sp. DR5-3]MCW3818914.1 IclR family transcriptional regulator [Micromonospora sp. DR5-3]
MRPRQAVDDDRPASANYHTHALARGLSLLEMLAAGPQPLTLIDFHERTGLPKSTLVRLLSVLGEMQFVVRVDERPAFRLGHKVLSLSTAYVSALDLSVVAGPHLRELARASGQTANLGLLDGDQVLHVCVEEPDRPIRFTVQTGTRDSTHCTALGKMLLAGLDPEQVTAHVPAEPMPRRTDRTITSLAELRRELRRTAERGHAFDDNEGSVGLRCLAVPVHVDGEQIAAISVSGPSGEVQRDRHRTYLDQLHATASAMAADGDVVAALGMVYRSLMPPKGGLGSA